MDHILEFLIENSFMTNNISNKFGRVFWRQKALDTIICATCYQVPSEAIISYQIRQAWEANWLSLACCPQKKHCCLDPSVAFIVINVYIISW